MKYCYVEDCNREVWKSGFCLPHQRLLEALPQHTGSCRIPDCPKPAAKGLPVCWAHYQRARRGSVNVKPVREYIQDNIHLASPRVRSSTAELIEAVANRDGVSVFAAEREIVTAWINRLESGNPWLMKTLPPSFPTLVEGRNRVPMPTITIDKSLHAKFQSASKSLKQSLYMTAVMILEDWATFYSRSH